MTTEQYIDCCAEIVNKALKKYLPEKDLPQGRVCDAMEYSIMAGGKRIRPMLTLEFCRVCGGEIESALPFACAVEMIHTYSLIHDDLPCMDNDDMRRGKPSCHAAFGENTALLAGDALLTYAFETLLTESDASKIEPANIIAAAGELAHQSGVYGMVGGQMMDLQYEGKSVDVSHLNLLHSRKTGALMCAAATLGCYAANRPDMTSAAREYAENIGLAFQIVDDILDVTSSETELGKPIGSDSENNKTTYVTVYGIEKSRKIAAKLTNDAKLALAPLENEAHYLTDLADMLLGRRF